MTTTTKRTALKGAAMALTLALVGTGLASGAAQAQWPEKPIKVIVPFQPGGSSDQVTRA